MEPAEDRGRPRRIELSGTVRVSCGGTSFRIHLEPGRRVIDFPSLGDLLRTRAEMMELKAAIQRLPQLPGHSGLPRAVDGEIQVSVRMRPVGKLVRRDGGTRFNPTPLAFFKRLV